MLCGQMEIGQNGLGSDATWWIIQIKVNPTKVSGEIPHPVEESKGFLDDLTPQRGSTVPYRTPGQYSK